MTEPRPTASSSSQEEEQFHTYEGTKIPWYVHVLWVGFWIGAISYTLIYIIPAMKTELLSPP